MYRRAAQPQSFSVGIAGVSGSLSFSSGTANDGNSGLLSLGTGASTAGKAGSVNIGVGSGNSGIGGNMYVKAGQTWASYKDGGHVAVMAGSGGQTDFVWDNPSKQYHLRDVDCHLADCSSYTHNGQLSSGAISRESDSPYSAWHDDHTTPPGPRVSWSHNRQASPRTESITHS